MNKPLFHCIVEGISSISTAYRKENFVMIDDRSKKNQNNDRIICIKIVTKCCFSMIVIKIRKSNFTI